jgi:DNA-binding XRE family transcriptional regulator
MMMDDTVTIPIDEYQALKAAAEDYADLQAYDRAMAAVAAGEDELVPADVVARLLAGEGPLRTWREFRGMTQMALASASSVNRVQIANIEAGTRSGSVATLKKLANALAITVDDLV